MEDVVGVATASGSSAAAAVNKRKRRLLMHCSGGNSIGKYCQQGGGESEGTSRDWSALPEPALYLIMEKKGLLPGALADLISMGGVCKSWRSVFGDFKRQRFPSMPPFLISSQLWTSARRTSDLYSLMEGRHLLRKEPLSLAVTMAETVSVSHGYWLVQCIGCKCGVAFLMDPLATAGSPTLRIDLPRAPGPAGWRYNYSLGNPDWRYHVMTASPMSPECTIISLGSDFILYCRPGDPHWSTYKFCGDHGNGETMRFCPHGLAVLEGKAYVLAENGELLILDSLFPEPHWRVLTVDGLPLKKKERDPPMAVLAESGGEIMLIFHVQELPWITEGFLVYRLDLPARKWVRVSSLGGNTVFLNRFAPPVTCHDAAKWGGASDCIYWHCGYLGRLLLFHVKDERSEYHPLSEVPSFSEFMIPSFCYSSF